MRAALPKPRWALTPPFHLFPDKRGSLFSVALSVRLPCPAVSRHRFLVESGLSSTVKPPQSPSPPRSPQIRAQPAQVNHSPSAFFFCREVLPSQHDVPRWPQSHPNAVGRPRVKTENWQENLGQLWACLTKRYKCQLCCRWLALLCERERNILF